MTRSIENEILKKYTGSEAWSFGGIDKIHKHFAGRVSRRDIVKILEKINVYTRFKRKKKSKIFSPIYVFNRRELWQADTVFFTNPNLVDENEGYSYLFTIIDCFSKMAWAIPLKKILVLLL